MRVARGSFPQRGQAHRPAPPTDRIALQHSVCPSCGSLIEPGAATRMVQSVLDGFLVPAHRDCPAPSAKRS